MIEYLKALVDSLPAVYEETKIGLLREIYKVKSFYDKKISNLEKRLAITEQELQHIRKVHEHEPIMPFYDTLPSTKIAVQDNIYDLRVAVQGKVEHDATRPMVALSVREYGQPKNFANQVWVDKFALLTVEDRVELINCTLQEMSKQMQSLFDKEYNRV